MPATSSPICGYIIGSPPQMETMGAPHSSTTERHSSSGTRSVIVFSYSRMRPQPVQVRLQACSGSSMSTIGKRLLIMGCGLRFSPTLDARMHAKTRGIAAGDQSQNRPRGLRGSTGAGRENSVIVAGAIFAPAAIGVLNRTKPFAGAQHVRLAIVLAGRGQAAQREARP